LTLNFTAETDEDAKVLAIIRQSVFDAMRTGVAIDGISFKTPMT